MAAAAVCLQENCLPDADGFPLMTMGYLTFNTNGNR